MAQIAIFPFPEEGHFIPALSLAQRLKDCGHEVYFLVFPDFVAFIQEKGFQCFPLLPEVFPLGTKDRQVARQLSLKPGFLSKAGRKDFQELIRSITQVEFQEKLCEKLSNSTPEILSEVLGQKRPDILFVDVMLPTIAALTHTSAIFTILFNAGINTSRQADPTMPYSGSSLIPRHTNISRLLIALEWSMILGIRGLLLRLAHSPMDRQMREIIEQYHFAQERIEQTPFYLRLQPAQDLPEIVLYPRSLDYPHAERKSTYYLSSFIPKESQEDHSFPWDKLAADKSLIYCTLGSQSHLLQERAQFFQKVIDAVAQRPDWQLVLATGRKFDIGSLRLPSTANVTVVNWAPQAQLLRRAAVVIHQGGSGTILECIYHDVPMVMFPILRDHPGTAARAEYYKLGMVGKFTKVSVPLLLRLLDATVVNPIFQENVRAMHKKLVEDGQEMNNDGMNQIIIRIDQLRHKR